MAIRGGLAAAAACACALSLVHPVVGLAASDARHQCSSSETSPSVMKKVVISRPGHRTHVRLGVGDGLRVVAHDRSAYGVRRPQLLPGSTAMCWLHRGGTRHRKWVLFVAVHHGKAQIEWVPRVAPGTGAAEEFVTARVL